MGSLIVEGVDLKTVGISSRKKWVGLTGRRAGSVALPTLLSPTGSEGNLGAKSDSSKSRELHFEGGTGSDWCKEEDKATTVGPGSGNAQRPLVKRRI